MTGKPVTNPPMSWGGVSVVIVLGARESRVHGEGPQPRGGSEQTSPNANRRNLRGCR